MDVPQLERNLVSATDIFLTLRSAFAVKLGFQDWASLKFEQYYWKNGFVFVYGEIMGSASLYGSKFPAISSKRSSRAMT